jgi:Effector-associated domain 1/Trypsin-like peptidase domain
MPRLVAGDKKLSGAQFETFYNAVLDAYGSVEDLSRVLSFKLDRQLNLIVSESKPLDDIVFTLISKADVEGWSAEFLQALRGTRPTNQRLLVFAQQFELAPATPERSALELLIKEGDALLDVVSWRTKLGELESRVCRIERDGLARGTGFLVGPSVVMTNYHVLEDVIDDGVSPDRIGLRFDYKILANGIEVNPGKVYKLAAEWDIQHSPYSKLDTQVDPPSIPGADELDYALVRVDGAPGSDGVTGLRVKTRRVPRAGSCRFLPASTTGSSRAP